MSNALNSDFVVFYMSVSKVRKLILKGKGSV